MEEIADAELAGRLAKALANATTGFHNIPMQGAGFEVRKIAVGTALLSLMRRIHGGEMRRSTPTL